ncbi:MAG: hypothetical protein V4760_05060 [Bdellovibrionota bacterium]
MSKKILSTLVAVSFVIVGCESTRSKKAELPTPKNGWSAKMQALSTTLSDLLPLVTSKKKFADPKNDARIEADVKAVRALAHSLKTGEQPSSDPSMQIMTGLFEADIARALDALKTGNRDYARHVLKDTTSYCIQCHTATSNGPDFPRLNLDIDTKDLTPVDRAEFYAATRQFDAALSSYISALDDQTFASEDPFEWEAAARGALAIAVRVKQNPADTMKVIAAAKSNSKLAKSSKTALTSWENSVKEWAKETQASAETPPQMLQESETLIRRAQKRQEFPLDHSQDILYFRAGSRLHELLQQPPATKGHSKELRARALYWAGVASEATRDMNFWTMHETMYEQCIRLRPGTEQARQCFARLKESVTLGYTGSAGVNIPAEVSARLESFRVIAEGPKAQAPTPETAKPSDKPAEATPEKK